MAAFVSVEKGKLKGEGDRRLELRMSFRLLSQLEWWLVVKHEVNTTRRGGSLGKSRRPTLAVSAYFQSRERRTYALENNFPFPAVVTVK